MKDLLYYARLALESAASVFGLRPYEAPRYEVIGAASQVELRRYAPRRAVEAKVRGPGARDEAFRALFRYICGSEKIAMTTPVATRGGTDEVRMQFFLPARYQDAAAPVPFDRRLRLVELPEETLAVLRFSGRATPHELAQQKSRLLAAVAAAGWRPTGEAVVFTYDPPFTLPFLRRNEVAVKVAP